MEDRPRGENLPLHLATGTVLLGLGALEGFYGRPELFGDDISYLDVAHAIRLADWGTAFNPLWSIGYPLLLTVVRFFLPSAVHGELLAVLLLNLLIYAGTWLSLLYLLRCATQMLGGQNQPLSEPLVVAAACVFATAELTLGRVSSVGPDNLVTLFFLLACALLLRFHREPTLQRSLSLGLVLGLGFIAKAVFLPLSIFFLAAAFLVRRGLPPKVALAAPATLFSLMLPYAACISWAIGRATLGESGALNYAFHVNQLPHWMGWQGGPSRLGDPVHPVHLLREHPAVFAFGEPFHVTYPPQFNLAYWYDGYHHFFSPPNASRAVLTNLHALFAVLHENVWLVAALAVAIGLLFFAAEPEFRSKARLKMAWPIYLPAIFGVLLYLQVHLEARYIAGFLLVIALLPFLLAERAAISRTTLVLATTILALGTSSNLELNLRPTILRALEHAPVETTGQWAVAHALQQAGLHPGDRVASVGLGNNIRCTWAYAAGLHVVAAIGNDAYDPGLARQDFDAFWTQADTQSQVLTLFRQNGARAVVISDAPAGAAPPQSAWIAIPNTNAYVLFL